MIPVAVEIVVGAGLPGMTIVGMPDAAVQEARERVRAAIRAAGFTMPPDKIVVNLAPGHVRKTGSGFDLPIAVGILAATGQIDPAWVADALFAGELSLDGSVRPVAGMLGFAVCARSLDLTLFCSKDSDLMALDRLAVAGLSSLEVLRHDGGFREDLIRSARFCPSGDCPEPLDFKDVSGHEVAKRAFQIAAAGSHGLLMMGPPGSGKTMLASRMPGILPELTESEKMETAVIHSVGGEPIEPIVAGRRPFRSPHHSATLPGLVGGGHPLRPGEISLAHNGVLFLDELGEFKSSVLQGIRQPLESGEVCLTRADGKTAFPARFVLVAATNPCPCGYFGDAAKPCQCSAAQIARYQGRIGGPLLDRIDIHLDVNRLDPARVLQSGTGTSSARLREGVMAAREFASWRQAATDGAPNAEGSSPEATVRRCRLGEEARQFLVAMAKANSLSGRGIMRTLGVARTIADLEQAEAVEAAHVAEALGFRLREGIGG